MTHNSAKEAVTESARKRLVFALDLPAMSQAAPYIEALKDHVGMFKVGLELFTKEGRRVVDAILEKGGPGVFLDLKLHDIPTTVYRTMRVISDMGVLFTTVHCTGQDAMLAAARDGAGDRVGVLGVTVLTSISADDLGSIGFSDIYVKDPSRLVMDRAAAAARHGFAGVVCSALEAHLIKERFGESFLAVTPGIRTDGDSRDDQGRVATPALAIDNGADFLVVGRPVRDASDPAAAADRICLEIENALARRPSGRSGNFWQA